MPSASETFEAWSPVERDCIKALEIYEQHLYEKHKRKRVAGRVRQQMHKHGIVRGIDVFVRGKGDRQGFSELTQKGMDAFTFEAVVLRHKNAFSEESVAQAKERQNKRKRAKAA